jgi:hypothetical protein
VLEAARTLRRVLAAGASSTMAAVRDIGGPLMGGVTIPRERLAQADVGRAVPFANGTAFVMLPWPTIEDFTSRGIEPRRALALEESSLFASFKWALSHLARTASDAKIGPRSVPALDPKDCDVVIEDPLLGGSRLVPKPLTDGQLASVYDQFAEGAAGLCERVADEVERPAVPPAPIVRAGRKRGTQNEGSLSSRLLRYIRDEFGASSSFTKAVLVDSWNGHCRAKGPACRVEQMTPKRVDSVLRQLQRSGYLRKVKDATSTWVVA